jgi:sec-independent protein translocase protein TatA
MLLGLFNMGGGEIVLILAVVLLLFGAKKLPELAKGLGQGIREFKKASNEVTDELQRAAEAEPPVKKLPPEGTEPQHSVPQNPQQPS